MEQNPLLFMQEYDKALGQEGKGRELIQKNSDKLQAEIDKTQKALDKEITPNKVVALTKKLKELQERKQMLDAVLKPEETIADIVEEGFKDVELPAEAKEAIEEIRNPQVEETIPFLPDGTVDYYALFIQNPKKYIEIVNQEEGEGAAERNLANFRIQLIRLIADTRRALEKAKDPKAIARLKEKLKHHLESKRKIDDILNPPAETPKAEEKPAEVKEEKKEEVKETPKAEEDLLNTEDVRFSKRTKPAPKKTGKGYKVFVLKDGKLYPPMVANPEGADTPMGVWLDADAAPQVGVSKTGRPKVKSGGKGTQGSSGSLAYRPGWHLGEIPYALQFNRGEKVENPLGITNKEGRNIKVGKEFPNNFVWAEVEYAKDKDYQDEAMSYGYNKAGNFQHQLAGLPRVPEDGSYKYRTNANPATDPWIITGAMKVNRILSREEVDDMVRKAGREPQKIQKGDVLSQEVVDKLNNQKPAFSKKDASPEEIKAHQKELQSYLNTIDTISANVCTRDTLLSELEKDGATQEDIDEVKESLQDSIEKDYDLGGLVLNEKIYLIAEDVRTNEGARLVYVHERQHVLTRKDRILLDYLREGGKPTKEHMLDIIDKIDGTGDLYPDVNWAAALDEAVSKAMEIAYSVPVEDFENVLRKKGITDDFFINFVKNLNDEQSKDSLLSKARRGRESDGSNDASVSRAGKQDSGAQKGTSRGVPETAAGRTGTLQRPEVSEGRSSTPGEEVKVSKRQAYKNKSLFQALAQQVSRAGLDVSTDTAEGQSILQAERKRLQTPEEKRPSPESGVRFLRSSDGKDVYGFVKDGKIYLDPDAPAETPLHEYSHLWLNMYQKLNPKESQNLINLAKQTELWDFIKKNYPELKSDTEIAEELIANFSGRRGLEKIKEMMHRLSSDKTTSASYKMRALKALEKLRRALEQFWRQIAEYFGLKFTSAEEIADTILADFVRRVNPNEVIRKVEISDRQYAKAEEVLKYFNSKGFKDGEIVRSISDHGVSTYIYGDWGNGTLTKYRISDHGIGSFRSAYEITFQEDTRPETLYKRSASIVRFPNGRTGTVVKSGEEQQQQLSDKDEYTQLWNKHGEELKQYNFRTKQTPLDMKEALEKFFELANAKYLQRRKNKDGSFTYEYSEPKMDAAHQERPTLNMLRAIDSMEGPQKPTPEKPKTSELKAKSSESLFKNKSELTPKQREIVDTKQFKDWFGDSKIVDKDGTPLVVYHDTNSKVYVNKETGENWDDLSWEAKEMWEKRDDWDKHWEEKDFYTFDNKNHGRRSVELPAFFFSPKPDPHHEYGKRRISAFLSIKNPAIDPEMEDLGRTDTAGQDAMNKLIEQGYDGVIRTRENGEVDEIMAFRPEQIKSADPNTYDDKGNPIPVSERFSKKPDIRFSKNLAPISEAAQEAVKETVEEAKAVRKSRLDEIRKKMKSFNKKGVATAQRGYDQETVKSISDLAKELMSEGLIDAPSKRDMQKALTLLSHTTGKENLTASVNRLMEIMADNQVRNYKNLISRLMKTRASRLNQSGVRVMSKLDASSQAVMKTLKDWKDSKVEDIDLEIAKLQNKIAEGTIDKEQVDEIETGLRLAKEYAYLKDNLTANRVYRAELEEKRKEFYKQYEKGKISYKAYRAFADGTRVRILDSRLDDVAEFADFANSIAKQQAMGSLEAKAFRAGKKQLTDDVHHAANSDTEGRKSSVLEDKNTRDKKLENNKLLRFIFKPLATYDMILRFFGARNVRGEGNLFNMFFRGYIDAANDEASGEADVMDKLAEKTSEVLGKKKKRWTDLYSISRKDSGVTVDVFYDGEWRKVPLTNGNCMAIYMWNKMPDGATDLRYMGITEEAVEKIKNQMDPKLVKLADYVQSEIMPELYKKYDKVHRQVFGAPLGKVDNYVWLKPLKDEVIQREDISELDANDRLPSTVTGNIKERTHMVYPLDITGTDGVDLIFDYIKRMEHWAAFAPLIEKLNILLSYKKFKNRVLNMRSVYGSGSKLWKTFKDTARMAVGSYTPKAGDTIDDIMVNIAKGATFGKIAFRPFPAVKQLESFIAYFTDARPDILLKNLLHPKASWEWTIKNLPVLKKRWESRTIGDTRLMDTDSDWSLWRARRVQDLNRTGVKPNAFMDFVTVAIGAKSVYETRYKRYIREGYAPIVADKRAKQDAVILPNETQQSSEGGFVSTIQVDRTWLSVGASTFQNAPYAYGRQMVNGLENLKKQIADGKQESIDFMTKQMVRDGIDEKQARENATRLFNRDYFRNTFRVVMFGFVISFFWKAMSNLFYWLFGDDEKKKKELLMDTMKQSAVAPVEGFAGGKLASEAWSYFGANKKGFKWEDLKNFDFQMMPVMDDIMTVLKQMSYDKAAGVNSLVNLVSQMGLGVNPQTFEDMAMVLYDIANGDLDLANEIGIALARFINAPKEQVDQLLVDEVGIGKDEAMKMSLDQLAERYANYKYNRGATATGWAADEAEKKKRLKYYQNQFKGKVEERKALRATAEQKAYDEAEKKFKTLEQIRKDLKKDVDEAKTPETKADAQMKYNEFISSPEYRKYAKVKGVMQAAKKAKELKKRYQGAGDELLDEILEDMKKDLVEELNKENK